MRRPEPVLGLRSRAAGGAHPSSGAPPGGFGGWGKKNIELDDVGGAGCMGRETSAKWAQREGSFFFSLKRKCSVNSVLKLSSSSFCAGV